MIEQAIDCFTQSVTVRRVNQATSFVDGLAQVVTDVDEFCVDHASVQPMKANERMVMPEGIRDSAMIKIYTDCRLLCVDIEGKKRADRLDWKGEEYVVQSCEDWVADGGYYKIVAIKEND